MAGKKGAKKGKKEKSADGAGPAGSKGDELDELSKQFYLVQIRDLEEKLARYQQKCDVLTQQNDDYLKKYHAEELEKKDITDFLRRQCDEKTDEVVRLHEDILTMQIDGDKDKMDHQNRYSTLKEETTEQIDRLRAESALLNGSLASLQDFKVRKDELEAQYKDLEANLDSVNNLHRTKIYKLERKQVIDKDRLKREMVSKVNEVSNEFRRISNQQMAETTKRTIQENVAVNSQLVKLTDKTKDLMAENESLRAKLAEQSRKIEMLEKIERELSRKNHCSARLISLLTERSNELETDLSVTEEVLEETRATVENLENTEHNNSNIKQGYETLVKNYEKLLAEHLDLEDKNKDTCESLERYSKVIDQCSIDLSNHLMGHNTNILPTLLSALSKEASEDAKKQVDEKLGHKRDTYNNGSLGLVSEHTK